MADKNRRIEHIDIMKGIAIILVVFGHVACAGYDNSLFINTILSNVRMPLYFFISGLFISTSKKFPTFFVDKLNKHIIPFLFFGVVYLLIEALILYPKEYASFLTAYHSFFVVAVAPANLPIWFLETLFFGTILFYCLIRIFDITFKKYSIQLLGIASLALSIAGLYLSEYAGAYQLSNPLSKLLCYTHISVSLEILPFFYVAYVLRKNDFLHWNPTDKTRFILMGLSLVVALLAARQHTSFYMFQYDNPRILMFIAAFSGILFMWLATQWLTLHAPRLLLYRYLNYLGRYSIIILGIHWSYINMCTKWFPETDPLIWFAGILIAAPATIWLFKRLFPWFTAQKELIPVPRPQTVAVTGNTRISIAAEATDN